MLKPFLYLADPINIRNNNFKFKNMKKHLLLAILITAGAGFSAYAQTAKPKLKKETVTSSPVSTPDDKVATLQRPTNDKNNPAPPTSSRGDVYGANYSDVVIDNWTGYYILCERQLPWYCFSLR